MTPSPPNYSLHHIARTGSMAMVALRPCDRNMKWKCNQLIALCPSVLYQTKVLHEQTKSLTIQIIFYSCVLKWMTLKMTFSSPYFCTVFFGSVVYILFILVSPSQLKVKLILIRFHLKYEKHWAMPILQLKAIAEFLESSFISWD